MYNQFNYELQCDGVPLNISEGPTLQGITFLNIPSTHGGTNMWGDSKARATSRKKRKEKMLLANREMSSVSSSSLIDPDLSAAVQGIIMAILISSNQPEFNIYPNSSSISLYFIFFGRIKVKTIILNPSLDINL